MQRKKLNALLCGLALGVSIWLPGQVSAEVRTVEADGVYQMGDGMAENQAIAKERARVDAVRSAGEQAAAYVESDTLVSNGKVTKDDIRLMTAAVLELRDVKYTPVIVGESIQFKCHVVAVVDTDKVQEKIREDNLTLKASLQKYEEENERLRREMETLKQQYQKATPAEKKEIEIKVYANDKAFEANQLFEKAWQYQKNGDSDETINYYDEFLKIRPNDAVALNNIGCEYFRKGQYEKALEWFERKAKIEPDYTVFKNMGTSYFALQQYEKALEYFEKSSLLKPNAETFYDMGVVYQNLGHHEKAVDNYKKAVKMKVDYIDAYNNMAYIFHELGNREKTIEYYEKIISIRPNAKIYLRLGNEYQELLQFKKAIDYYKLAISLKPDYLSAYYHMGLAYERLGLSELADECYKKSGTFSIVKNTN